MAVHDRRFSFSHLVRAGFDTAEGATGEPLQELLRAIRSHLGMDVAFISQFTGGRRVFRHVDSGSRAQPVRVDGSDPLEESYCQRVVDGRLPELIRDATALPAAMELPVTAALPVGAHLSVPIRLKDGCVYGTFCCFSFKGDQSLNERDLTMMRVFADVAAHQIDRDLDAVQQRNDMETRIATVLAGDDPVMLYQPIHDIEHSRVMGFEALARFSAAPIRTPDVWFAEAGQIGRAIQLEIKAMQRALSGFSRLGAGTYISINTSPETILSGEIMAALRGHPLGRIVLEITEHASVRGYAELSRALASLRSRGLRIAVDDAGAGYASFRHILALEPDLIKLDMSLTRDIHTDGAKRALASAFVSFARGTRCEIIAEGVESVSELEALRSLGVSYAQGYVLGRPMPLTTVAARAELLHDKKAG